MKPERWHEVSQLFQSALAREPSERALYLQEACGDDDALRRQVESLLAAHDKADDVDFINAHAVERAAPLLIGDEATPGEVIGHYKILKRIGAGGMGEVYLAEDTTLERKVALKVLLAEIAQDEDRVRRFIQEAKAASALNHPNILTVYEVGNFEDTRYIVTEFIKGETLRERTKSAPLALRETLDVAVQVAAALNAAHEAGIVHRDIKPENIMLRADGLVKVLDFGLAKLSEPPAVAGGFKNVDSEAQTRALVRTAPGMIMGTVSYMSPEQARGLATDARTDIFSFGVVLYEMLAGRLPFAGETMSDVMAAILRSEPAPLGDYVSEMPKELERIVGRTLRKNADERYQHVKDLLIDLRDLKQELEFTAKLERTTAPPKATTNKTPNESAAIRNIQNAPTISSAEYLAGEIKNHKLPALVALLLLIIGSAALYRFTGGNISNQQTSNATIDSIAVLPFENVSHEQNIEYLSDGVTESLINSLSQLPHIKVIARSSVFRYKNQTPDLQQVARQLGVQAILTGRVLAQGDTLNVSVEMTNMQDNTQLWGQHYTQKAADIFGVQDEIARLVTDTLRVRLTGTQQEQVTKRYTENPEAYRLYLQGRYYMNDFSEGNLNRAIPLFDQAIALDPRYALAYAARGESFFYMGGLSLPMSEAIPKAKQDIAAALSIDDKLVEARTIQAAIKFQFDWDFAGAEEDFRRAIALNPNYAEVHHQYAYYLGMMGRPMEGVAEMKLAQQLDPVNPSINVDLNLPYYIARQFDQSIAQSRKALEMFPNFYSAHWALGSALVEKGDYTAGIEELEKAKTMQPTPSVIGNLGYAYAKAGRKDEARKLLAALKELSKQRYVSSYWIAMIYVGLNEKDEAFAWLEKAFQERSWWLMWIKMDPMVDSLRSDPRFQDLLRRIGFTPSSV